MEPHVVEVLKQQNHVIINFLQQLIVGFYIKFQQLQLIQILFQLSTLFIKIFHIQQMEKLEIINH